MTAKVSHVFQHGICLAVDQRRMFLSYGNFPWFKDASVAAIENVELLNERHLYWPDLDIDLTVESIERPERFPLVAK